LSTVGHQSSLVVRCSDFALREKKRNIPELQG
jgi:hypothetical protein